MGRYSDNEAGSGDDSSGSTRSDTGKRDEDSFADEEPESDLEEGGNRGFPEGSYRYDKHEKKIRKEFGLKLLENALESGWEG